MHCAADSGGDDGGGDDGGVDEIDHAAAKDDIFITMKCVFVCHEKIITSHFRAERRRREVSRLLGLPGRRPALA